MEPGRHRDGFGEGDLPLRLEAPFGADHQAQLVDGGNVVVEPVGGAHVVEQVLRIRRDGVEIGKAALSVREKRQAAAQQRGGQQQAYKSSHTRSSTGR